MEMMSSAAFEFLPVPDWAATTTIAVDDGANVDASEWARAVFDLRAGPAWVRDLFAVRQMLVPFLGISQGTPQTFAVREVRNGQAIIDTDNDHLRFVASVYAEPRLLHVTAAVQLKGWRGRLYFLPIRFLHDQITRSMMHNAARNVQAAQN